MKCSIAERRLMVSGVSDFSILEQCGMLGIHRSGFYYVPQGESVLNLELMKLIDSYFLDHPHSGALTLCAYLCLSKGYKVNVRYQ